MYGRRLSLVQVQRECRFLVSMRMSSYLHLGTDSTCGHLYCKFPRNKSGNNSPRCPSILPIQVYGSTATYAHSTEVAGSPAIRQGRKQMDKAFMTLQQHFANSRRATIVAINLKRRMRTEQVGESAATMTSRRSIDSRMQQTLEEFPSTVSVTQTSPEVYLPSTAPTSTLISRRFKVIRQASASSGVDSGEIRFPGCSP